MRVVGTCSTVALTRPDVHWAWCHETLLADFPDRAIPVQVGSLAGAMTWADPLANGVRTHNVYWSDGTYNYSLIANRSGAAALTLARGMACR